MELHRLRHLLAVATHGTYRRAAEALHLTQPALTRSIQLLEAQVGMPLLTRGPRGSTLTEAGRLLVERARRLVREEEETRRELERLQRGVPTMLRVGVSATAHVLVARPFVARLTAELPDVQAELRLADTPSLQRGLHEGTLDVAIGDGESFAGDASLAVELLDTSPIRIVARPGHPLAARGEATFDALRGYTFAASPITNVNARRIIERLGAERIVRLTSVDHATMEALVRETDVLLVANALATARAVMAGELVVVPFAPLRAFSARLAFARPVDRPLVPGAALVRACMFDAIADARRLLGGDGTR
jgi:DNA-binding transcriptional LysR family regulator